VEELVGYSQTGEFTYIGFAEEGLESKTPHLQGWIRTHTMKTLVQMKSYNERMHLEIMYGNYAQNDAYCTKERHMQHFGHRPTQGMAKTTSATADMFIDVIDNKMPDDQLLDKYKHVYARSYKAVQHVRTVQAKPPNFVPKEVSLVYGKTRAGKTEEAYKYLESKGLEIFKKDAETGKWWDGYCGERGVILDDVTGSVYTIETIKCLLDHRPTRVQYKGGVMTFAPSHIVITSNHHYNNWWLFPNPADLEAVAARIHNVFPM